MSNVRVAMAQVNPTLGDIEGNKQLVIDAIDRAVAEDIEILLLPELIISGYPPEDLVYRKDFLDACYEAVFEISKYVRSHQVNVFLGYPEEADGKVYNSMAVLSNAGRVGTYRKMHLPNYSVFDERRHFTPGSEPHICELKFPRTEMIGLTICEDIWVENGPHIAEARGGAQMIVNISASPYHYGKGKVREDLLMKQAIATGVPIFYCNMWGGQDELIFDGQSLVVDSSGNIAARGKQYADDFIVCEVDLANDSVLAESDITYCQAIGDVTEEIYDALVLGVRDYVRKNGFTQAILGLSGGADSALVALLATDALGPENVSALIMPSKYSSDETQGDAHILAESLKINAQEIPILGLVDEYTETLKNQFAGLDEDVTEENLQARIRGNLLMAMSNKFGSMLLSTGNKSEMSVGYATLYGDMAGGFAVLKDVPKTIVFDLIRWRNTLAGGDLVPMSIVDRPPSAELRPDQQDTDSLPDYDTLDAIIELYVENDVAPSEIAKQYPVDVVKRVVGLIDLAEYKRRQAPPGIKITSKAFGRDRRLPITNHFRHGL